MIHQRKDLTVDTLVLLPGLEGTGALFADLISVLPPALKVIVASYPPQEFLSYSELVGWVLEIVPQTRPFLLVAESFSTPLAAKIAATGLSNLAGVVMCGGFVTNPVGKWSWLVRALAEPWFFRVRAPGWALRHLLIGGNPPAALEGSVRRGLRAVDPGVMSRRLRAVIDCDSREELAANQVPLMYIQAEHDRVVGPESFAEIKCLRPDTKLVSVPGPHLIFQSEPRKAAAAIVNFMQQLPAQPLNSDKK